ncbi:MAG: helix-turn-helix domain-containing protein [Synergistaceae bacterium]|nr:helix-turn-helix domain-containing protein [Synergistaceae bacterium]
MNCSRSHKLQIICSFSDKTVRRLVKSLQLTASKVGDRSWRIKQSEIEKYLDTHTNGKQGAGLR